MAETVTDEDLVDFYDARLPDDITSMAALAAWWKSEHPQHPHLLDFDPSKVERLQATESLRPGDYPDSWHTVGTDGSPIDLRLSYVYKPQATDDGVTVHVPLNELTRLTPEEFTWNVPGLLDELILATIKSLPKALRVQFVPAPDTARAIRAWLDRRLPGLPGSAPAVDVDDHTDGGGAGTGFDTGISGRWPDFAHVFTAAAIDVVGAQVHPEAFNDRQRAKLPPHLRMTFAVEQPGGRNGTRHPRQGHVLGTSKSLTELQRRFATQAQTSARSIVRGKATAAGDTGRPMERVNLLHRAGATAETRETLLWDEALRALKLPTGRISSRWLGSEVLILASAPYPSTDALVGDLQLAAVKRLLPHIDGLRDDRALSSAVASVSEAYEDTVYAVAHDVIRILRRDAEVDKAVSGPAELPMLAVLEWVRGHIAKLVRTGFVAAAPPDALPRIECYLHADLLRLRKARADKSRDVRWAWQAEEAGKLVDKALTAVAHEPPGPRHDDVVHRAENARWMLEEFYVSLWAQELGTPRPVSLQRLRRMLAG